MDAKAKRYKVLWDNGANACGEFRDRFSSKKAALAFGRAWRRDMRRADPPGRGYEFEVVVAEVVVATESLDKLPASC